MTSEQTGKSVAEQNLADHIGLIRQDIARLSAEISKGLEQRVTHSELNGLHELYKAQLEHMSQRIGSLDRHMSEALTAIKQDLEGTDQRIRDEESQRKRAVYTGITSLVVMIVGGALLYAFGIK